jgi:hypothetical protein
MEPAAIPEPIVETTDHLTGEVRIAKLCTNCEYWTPLNAEIGDCHHHSPVVVFASYEVKSVFPRTNASMWCGDFIPRIG